MGTPDLVNHVPTAAAIGAAATGLAVRLTQRPAAGQLIHGLLPHEQRLKFIDQFTKPLQGQADRFGGFEVDTRITQKVERPLRTASLEKTEIGCQLIWATFGDFLRQSNAR